MGECDLSEYNRLKQEHSTETGAYADDPNGCRHYMGVYERDAEYDRFITLGAKKYAYEHDGKITVTVSGVGKKKGGPELEKAGGLESFKEGFVFREAGGTESHYNDKPYGKYRIEDHEIYITPNVVIAESEYTLGITAEYEKILREAQKYLYIHGKL